MTSMKFCSTCSKTFAEGQTFCPDDGEVLQESPESFVGRVSDGKIYMVMEYVEGHTLDKELKARGRFTPEGALEVLEPVADVLDSAHARGVVHRDLKPENIMLGSDGRGGTVVKVLDLGIAKMVGGDVQATGVTSLTMAGQILGTP